jgi:acetyl esterase/lipase
MPLLTDDLRSRLPPLLSQEAEGDPMVYALCCAQHKAYYAALTVMLP